MMRSRSELKSRKAWLFLGLLVFGGFSVAPHGAQAQSSRDMSNRLSRIENEIETLNRAVYRGETPPPSVSSGANSSSSAAAEVRLQQLEIELQDLRGKIEEQSYNIRQMKDKLDRSLSDMELRLNDVESGQRGAANTAPAARYTTGSGSVSAPASSGASSGAAAPGDDFSWSSNSNAVQAGVSGKLGGGADQGAAAYENAFALLKAGKYDGAGTGFEEFLAQNPNHQLAGNAKYWLGETYYVRGKYDAAARIFAEGYQQYPKGTKAADNLLKLGMSLAAIGNTSDACVALSQLKQDFSAGSDAVLRRANQEIARLNCS